MGFGRIGGLLVVGGCVLFVVTGAIFVGGGTLHIGDGEIGSLALAASLALVAVGAAVLSVAGPWPLHGRVVRVGLGALAVGLVSLLVSSIVGAAASPGHEDQESLPMLVLLVVGLFATVLGPLITGLSLVRRPGPSRAVGSLLLAGMLLLVLTTLYAQPLQAIAGALVVLGGTGVGVLAINGSRSAPVASL